MCRIFILLINIHNKRHTLSSRFTRAEKLIGYIMRCSARKEDGRTSRLFTLRNRATGNRVSVRKVDRAPDNVRLKFLFEQ